MNVLVANNYYHLIGGSERYLFELNELLERHGHTVMPFTTANERNIVTGGPGLFVEPINVHNPRVKDAFRFVHNRNHAAEFHHFLRAQRPDIAHLHIFYGQLTGAILPVLRRHEVPIVQTLHDYKVICPVYSLVSIDKICEACEGRHFWRALPRRCNRGSILRTAVSVAESYVSRAMGNVRAIDQFVAPSEFMRTKVVQHGLPAERVATVPYCIDSRDYEPATTPGGYFLYFGRLERLKGIFTLLEAAAPLRAVRLCIVGRGSSCQELERSIESRGLDHVRVLGFKQGLELHNIIRNARCVVLPSEWYDNLPMSVLESHCLGRPVIGSRIGGIPEMIIEGEDGFLFEPGNVDALRTHLEWMAVNPEASAQMGSQGRAKVARVNDPDRHYEEIMAIYRRLL